MLANVVFERENFVQISTWLNENIIGNGFMCQKWNNALKRIF